MATKKSPAKSAMHAKAAGKKAAAKTPSVGDGNKASSAKKNSRTAKSEDNYTKPELRERIKDEVMAGDKGGRPGQWSARKAQLVAHEYVTEGGGYKHPRNEAQEHLKQWGDEHWHTADGEPAIRDTSEQETTHRYLPDAAWKELSPAETKATDDKKVSASHKGEQFVANTKKAKAARKHAVKESQ